ncbi:MAG: deoxyguanosinetriphosphate triphosphohydrolase [Anaerolineae bacterium]|nr:deoxyguanosinetriphosphate triphosphohydrolase [Anaerolineae bacterium]
MLITREEIEAEEAGRLAAYAMCSRDSKGRNVPEDEHLYRTAYQRDRDRIIHTTAFRRLEYKTQVFIITEGDYYRTRLTHTVEVAQIGRTMARALRVNEDLTEAICLAHDLGHSPFGHSGETALNELMTGRGGFDHNYQSFRIVEKLENRFPDFRGLNLSWEVREGILKHETEYDQSNVTDFEPEWRAGLEAQIVNFADEIAYTTADLDDGLRSGMIAPEQLKEVEFWRLVTDELGIEPDRTFTDMDRHRIIRRLVGKEVSDVVQATSQRLVEHNIQSVELVRNFPENLVTHSETVKNLNRQLKDFLFQNLYQHWRVMRMHLKAERLLKELFETYVTSPFVLPENIQRQAEQNDLHRIICDYIAGMTDRFAMEEHSKLFDPIKRV